MKIDKIIVVANYDGEILGGFNTWGEAREFMYRHYLETLDVKNALLNMKAENLARIIREDLRCIAEKNYIEDMYYTDEVYLDIEF